MRKRLYVVVTFHTTAEAMAMKQVADKGGLAGRLGPIPRKLSAGCGFAWLEPAGNLSMLEKYLVDHGLDYEDISLLDL